MKSKFPAIVLFAILGTFLFPNKISAQTSPCDVIAVTQIPEPPVFWNHDSTKYFVNVQDSAGVFQIYVGNAGDSVPTCISTAYTNGNCCGLFRSWDQRNKLQVQWHASGNFLICAVEKEFYAELLYVPYYPLRLGWLQCGIWMDVWAVTPDGNNWYNLATTIGGVTGPAFTPDGLTCVWSEADDSSNILVDVFGVWKLQRSNFVVNSGVPSFANTTDITPAGCRWNEPGNFAPDGISVLITADIGMTNAEGQDQFILNIYNGQIINLNNTPMVWDEHGYFSPDGHKILFMSSYPYQADTNSYHTASIKTEFMLMNADGTGLQQLTHFCDTAYYNPHPGIAAVGFWTPDGSRIYGTSLVFPDYNYWVIDFYGNCGNDSITSVNELAANDGVTIYPNPAQDVLNIKTAVTLNDASVVIVNTLGQIVKQIAVTDNTNIAIAIDDLENGVYFLEIKSKDRMITKKFIKQH
jgi:hypothetical protein